MDVRDHAVPKLQRKVERGELSVSAAADVATLPAQQQHEIAALSEREILEAAKAIRARKADATRAETIERIGAIAAGNRPLGIGTKYPIILADPPWAYENPPLSGGPANHFPTLLIEAICALSVADLATDDALLYLWATSPKLPECIEVLKAWGFQYTTSLCWIKDKIGTGWHARNQHELLLIGKRGNIPPPAVADRVSSVIYADRGRHSEKPAVVYELIERWYPTLPKIELFARATRPGWAAWGNEVREAADKLACAFRIAGDARSSTRNFAAALMPS